MINASQYAVEVLSQTFLRADGSSYYTGTFEAGEFVLEAGGYSGRGYCGEGADQPFGSEITEAFFTYKNPETGEEVEGTHIFFDDDYDGDYGIVRAAAGAGGSVARHPSMHARVDAEVEITFQPADGYKLDEVTGTCPGSLHYNVYTKDEKVTARRLMNHTAAITGDSEAFARGQSFPSTLDLLHGRGTDATAIRVLGVPGRHWLYSNGGYTILQ